MWDFGKVCCATMLALAEKGDSKDCLEPADCGVLICHGSETRMGCSRSTSSSISKGDEADVREVQNEHSTTMPG